MSNAIIAIDGPAGAGKSTAAKGAAKRLGYKYLDTGATYRCVTLYFIENLVSPKAGNLKEILQNIEIEFDTKGNVFLNGRDVTFDVRTKVVNDYVSQISAIPAVREAMVGLQRKIGENGNYVVDGRDIGSVVFPEAKHKFYLDASVEERAKRRFEEEEKKGLEPDINEVRKNLENRDKIDAEREHSPLKKLDEAHYIDSTNMSVEEVISRVISAVKADEKDITENHEENKKVLGTSSETNMPQENEKNNEELNNEAAANENSEGMSAEELEFRNALQKEESTEEVSRGKIIEGEIVQMDETFVYVDLDYKSEAKVKREEFEKEPKIGEKIKVQIVKTENSQGELIASKSAVDRIEAKQVLENAWKNGENVSGVVNSAIKGGFKVSIGGIENFCPSSQIDMRRADPESYVGKEFEFRVIEKKGKDVILSRRVILEEKKNYNVSKFFETLNEGDIIKGKIKSIVNFGVFVEIIDGFDGFMALSNISWDKSKPIKELIQVGEEREFKVLSIDRPSQKVELGIKQLSGDPWESFIEQFKEGDNVKGEVSSVKQYGAFIKILDGVEGLAHVSEFSWTKRVDKAQNVVKKGDVVEAKILSIDEETKKVSLGLKQVQENPWSEIDKLFPRGSKVEGTTKKILKNFAVIELPNEMEGTIDISDFSWTQKTVNINNFLKPGESQDFIILHTDADKHKIKLGYKQLEDNPWEVFENSHPVGSLIEAEVIKLTDSGAVVKLDENIDGFVHISQLSKQKVDSVSEVLKQGEKYGFVIREIDKSKKRVSLSRKDYFSKMEQQEMDNYLSSSDDLNMTYSLGDKLGDKDGE